VLDGVNRFNPMLAARQREGQARIGGVITAGGTLGHSDPGASVMIIV